LTVFAQDVGSAPDRAKHLATHLSHAPMLSPSTLRYVTLGTLALLAPIGGAHGGGTYRGPQDAAMDGYVGRSVEQIPDELRQRARFFGPDLQPLDGAPQAGCVLLQHPTRGSRLDAASDYAFVVANSVVAPNFVGLSLGEARALAGTQCLSLAVVPACGRPADRTSAAATPNSRVVEQCTAAGSSVDVGNQIGVVVSPADDPVPLLLMLAAGAAALFLLALGCAVWFYVRYSAARDELAIFKSPKRKP